MPSSARPRHRPSSVVAPFALALLLAACSATESSAPTTTGPPPTTTAAADDPQPATAGGGTSTSCAPDAAVSGAVGATVTLDPPSSEVEGCHYYSSDGDISVGIVIEDPTTRGIEDVERNIEVERVPDVGDTAYVSITPGGIVQFGVFAGTRHVLVTVQGVDADAATGQAVYDLFA